jgi:hypothetical protein
VHSQPQIVLYPHYNVDASKTGSTEWIPLASDSRLKEHVVAVDPAVASAELCALRLVTYDFTAEAATAMGTTGRHTGWTGFLAQEFDEAMGVAPEDYNWSGIDLPIPATGGAYRTIDTGRAKMLLFAGHKHAMAQIAALTARLDAAGL